MTGVDEGFGIGVMLARGVAVSVMEIWVESASGVNPTADGSGEGGTSILRFAAG